MKIKLLTGERIYALAILNQFKGSLDTLVDILEDVKELRMTEDDWVKADKQVVGLVNDKGEPITQWTWNDEKGGEKEVVVNDQTKKYLLDKINELNDKGEFTIQDKSAITLKMKLEAKEKIEKVK